MEPYSFSSSAAMAQKTWELENNIVTMETPSSTESDAIFHHDEAAQAKFQQEKPWSNDPHYFKRVKVSALALLKMVVHSRSGGTIEVMGLMQGKTDGDAIIVMDAFALPVEGTETRVNAQADAYEYMVDYSQTNKQFRACVLIGCILMVSFIGSNVLLDSTRCSDSTVEKGSSLAITLRNVTFECLRSPFSCNIKNCRSWRHGGLDLLGGNVSKVKNDSSVTVFKGPVGPLSNGISLLLIKKQVGRLENVVGWYHSHPGYGCWLSGIDVSTQMLNQQFQEPFLAVVIDPTRTVSAGKVEIGAFRTYPEGYKPPDEPVSEYQTIPLNKIEDFGVHCKQYYSLDITYFKSSLDCHLLDLLWNKYWVNTLSSSPLLGNKDYVAGQISDLAEKLEQAENQLAHSRFGPLIAPPQRKKEEESQIAKITKDSAKITVEQVHGLMSQVIKDTLFNSVRQFNGPRAELSGPEPMVES
ncbi:hypothetical protein RHSIM_RhsimUnG0126200 [Rhododendron simsii]|uniref:COP9 signalosome complex subunit 5 n=1 Tax=Rhododendron simsii TaxID=118357 RepID=A0A834FUK6_RHOSS|nr:hypothetical protein RHSIM_RhsimUnG0126200 [Rhododendron simsii]